MRAQAIPHTAVPPAHVLVLSRRRCQRRAYGKLGSVHDPTMGWGAGGLYVQTFTLNVGCVYVRATARSIDLMERVEHRLATQGVRLLLSHSLSRQFLPTPYSFRASGLKLAYTLTALATLLPPTRESGST